MAMICFSIAAFVFCSLFISYQQSHAMHFRGAAKAVEDILWLSVGAGRIAQLVYLGLQIFWWHWWLPLITLGSYFGAGWLVQMILFEPIVDVILPKDRSPTLGLAFMSMVGFVAWPILATLRFMLLLFA
jgi:hypothetical protein